MSQITTHVLDTALGRPAAGVPVRLLLLAADREQVLATARTDADGRVGELGPEELDAGTYRLSFDLAAYAAATGQDSFFPEAALTFTVRDDSHHHVPLLLSPFAYSTYRGS
ncbi:hydroxyisourate hydrolase [Nocardioides immobilis]|uniref:5-hydroxyisourate hydrolase n=1 Tax=Nocardioides immobilis TaxID=2049295 RepID=A0A417Y0B4_9ACTN|nr:hydroxyisourate hydrolase [Nocardioides immobilis]RHW26063.1 hydroxyisourate hydrolase [Nocardioides immobilis]